MTKLSIYKCYVQNFINIELLVINMQKMVVFMIGCMLFAPFVFGFGLASDFLKNDILELAPGAEYEYHINIQNGQPGPIFVNITVTSDSSIASLNSDSSVFEIPAKNYDTQIPLRIAIPWYAYEGQTFGVSYTAAPVTGGGGLSLTIVLSRNFNVKVSKKGFISRGIYAEHKNISEVTTDAVKQIYAQKFKIGGWLIGLIVFANVCLLLWKRSGMIAEKIENWRNSRQDKQDDTAEQKFSMAYNTLPEFYRVMASIDGQTFHAYLFQYHSELYYWISRVAGEKFAKELMLSKTRKEFLQRLKYALQN